METFILQFFQEYGGEALKSDLAQDVMKFTIAWWIVRRSVKETLKGYFTSSLDSMEKIANNVKDLGDSLKQIEREHAGRIGHLERGMEVLKSEVQSLKPTKE